MRYMRNKFIALLFIFLASDIIAVDVHAESYQIGVYYFPGWDSKSDYWNDLRGLPGSRSPGKAWLDREPSRGFGYSEESLKIAEQNIEWAASYGISYYAYDWYWDGSKTYLNHAINNHLKASNNHKLKFCVLWANHSNVPESVEQFRKMVQYWIDNYLAHKQYLKIDGKPVIFILTPQQLRDNAKKFGKTTKDLLTIAKNMSISSGLKGIYFVGATPANSYWVDDYLPNNGYDALSAYNYQSGGFSGQYTGKEKLASTFEQLLEGYKSNWSWILKNSRIPYILPISAGWDRRPWGSNTEHDNCASTPASFKKMLIEGKKNIDNYPSKSMNMAIVYAWNEFGEGSYIEPTKKWGFQYLQAIKDVFGK